MLCGSLVWVLLGGHSPITGFAGAGAGADDIGRFVAERSCRGTLLSGVASAARRRPTPACTGTAEGIEAKNLRREYVCMGITSVVLTEYSVRTILIECSLTL